MIVLDTNVVSEAMKPEPAPAVRRFFVLFSAFLGWLIVFRC